MFRLVVANQRGGVSKTTTTITISRVLADDGLRVLAIDTDPQGSIGLVLGLKPRKYLHDFLIRNVPAAECVVSAAHGMDVLCSSRDTVQIDSVLRGIDGRESAFGRMLAGAEDGYDAIIIDVAPSISLLQTCALWYAQNLLIPVGMDMLSLQGAVASLETAVQLSAVFHQEIRAIGFLPAMLDRRFSLTAYVMEALEQISHQYGVPVLHPIRTDGSVPKAERARKSLVDYDARSKALEDYRAAAQQIRELWNAGAEPKRYAAALPA